MLLSFIRHAHFRHLLARLDNLRERNLAVQ